MCSCRTGERSALSDSVAPAGDPLAQDMGTRLTQCTGLMAAGDYQACTPLLTSLHGEAMAAGDRAVAAKAALLLAKVCANQAYHDRAGEWAGIAILAAAAVNDSAVQAQAWMVKGSIAATLGQPARAVQELDRALALLGDNPQDEVANTVFTGVGLTYMAMGMPVQAFAAHRRALDTSRGALLGTRLRMRINLLYAAADAYDLLAGIWQGEADQMIESVRGDLEQIATDARAVGTPLAHAGYLHCVGKLLGRIGRAQEACHMLAELCAMLPELPDGGAQEALIDLALAQRAAGMSEQAKVTLAAVRSQLPVIDPMQPQAAALRYASQVAELEGRPQEALALFRRYHSVVVRNEHAAFDARMAEMGATVHVLSLRQENAELRRSNDGLSTSFRQVSTLAATDPLTGVGNRRALESAFASLSSAGGALSVLMLDLDHFKSINDRYSHVVGDRVLREVATVLGHALRGGDFLGRYGGEEFTVLLAETGLATALPVADRLRLAVEAVDWSAVAPELRITVSGGVAQVRTGEAFDAAVARADALLYRAKRDGRNRIVGAPAGAPAAAA